jgi:hypothetical protein
MPLTREALSVEAHVVVTTTDSFARLGSFVHHVFGQKVTKGNPISLIGCRPVGGHDVTCSCHLWNARSWISHLPPYTGSGRPNDTVGFPRHGFRQPALRTRTTLRSPVTQQVTHTLECDRFGVGHIVGVDQNVVAVLVGLGDAIPDDGVVGGKMGFSPRDVDTVDFGGAHRAFVRVSTGIRGASEGSGCAGVARYDIQEHGRRPL